MKKVRKTLLIVLSVLIAMSMMLSACGANEGGNATTGTTDGNSSAAGDTAKLEPVTLRMVIPGPPQKDQALVNDAVSKYVKDRLNVTLNLEQIDWSTWQDKNNLIVASGEDCDIIYTAPWCGYNLNSIKGAFHDLTDLVQQYGPDIVKANYSWLLDIAKVNGRIYGIPSYQDLALPYGLFLRKDLVEKYQFTINPEINTPESLEPLLKQVKENEGITPLYMSNRKALYLLHSWDMQADLATGIDCTKGEAKWVNIFETDYYKQCMKTARRWFLEGYVNKDIATTKESMDNVLKAGKCFGFPGQPTFSNVDSFIKSTGQELVGCMLSEPNLSTGNAIGAMFSVPIQSKNPERAMMFINLMHSDKQLVNMLTYGIEGKHYVKKSDNAIEAAPGATSNNYLNLNWMFGNETFLYIYGNEDPEKYIKLDKLNQNALKSPALGFTYNPEKMKNEIGAIENIILQYDPGLATGALDPEGGKYEEFLSKLKAAGIDRLLADKQSQTDEWLKNNKK